MRPVIHSFFAPVFLAVCISPQLAVAQDTVEERSTGVRFPKTVSFQHDGADYTLNVTGVALRKKFFVKVYGMAHYWNAATFDDHDDALEAALSDEYAKQITMEFARDVDAEKIRNAFREGFEKNTSDEEMESISALVERFVGYFNEDVMKGKRYVLRWLPGGVVTTIIHGQEKDPIVSVTLADALWRIWLGEKSIVDRDDLVEMAVGD